MPRSIEIQGVVVPASAMTVTAVRAAGPGGQNVNKVSSKIDLRVTLTEIVGLTPGARARLRAACANRLDADGRLHLTSQVTRDQSRNLEDALEKVKALVAAALVVPIQRRATRPSRGAVKRRLSDKRHQSQRKAGRGSCSDD